MGKAGSGKSKSKSQIQTLDTIAEQLRQPALWSEFAVFERVMYKNKNQHRFTLYFRRLTSVRQGMRLLQKIEFPNRLQKLNLLLQSPPPPPPPIIESSHRISQLSQTKLPQTDRGDGDLCTEVQETLRQLWIVSKLVEKTNMAVLVASAHISSLIALSYFAKLAAVLFACLARFHVLLSQRTVDMVLAYNALVGTAVEAGLDLSTLLHEPLAKNGSLWTEEGLPDELYINKGTKDLFSEVRGAFNTRAMAIQSSSIAAAAGGGDDGQRMETIARRRNSSDGDQMMMTDPQTPPSIVDRSQTHGKDDNNKNSSTVSVEEALDVHVPEEALLGNGDIELTSTSKRATSSSRVRIPHDWMFLDADDHPAAAAADVDIRRGGRGRRLRPSVLSRVSLSSPPSLFPSLDDHASMTDIDLSKEENLENKSNPAGDDCIDRVPVETTAQGDNVCVRQPSGVSNPPGGQGVESLVTPIRRKLDGSGVTIGDGHGRTILESRSCDSKQPVRSTTAVSSVEPDENARHGHGDGDGERDGGGDFCGLVQCRDDISPIMEQEKSFSLQERGYKKRSRESGKKVMRSPSQKAHPPNVCDTPNVRDTPSVCDTPNAGVSSDALPKDQESKSKRGRARPRPSKSGPGGLGEGGGVKKVDSIFSMLLGD